MSPQKSTTLNLSTTKKVNEYVIKTANEHLVQQDIIPKWLSRTTQTSAFKVASHIMMPSVIVLVAFLGIPALQVNAAGAKDTAPINKLAMLKVQTKLTKMARFSIQLHATRKAEEAVEEVRNVVRKTKGLSQDFKEYVNQTTMDIWKSQLTAQISSNTPPSVIAAQMIDNFESYGNTLPVVNWPNPGGYMINPWGDPNAGPFPSLSTIVKADGTYSLRLDYNIQSYLGYVTTGHLLPEPDWSGWDGVRFVLWPDGSGRTVQFSFTEHIGWDGVKHFWFGNYQTTGTQPVIVYMPWSAFYQISNVLGGEYGHQMNLSGITEQSWLVKGTPGGGTFFIDKVELIKTASPLLNTIAIPFNSKSCYTNWFNQLVCQY